MHASHAGEFEGLTPGKESVPYASRYLGETQITDGYGNVLARLAYEDGDGVVTADITPGRIDNELAPIPEGFWTTELPSNTLQAWDYLNSLGHDYYAKTFQASLEPGMTTSERRAGERVREVRFTEDALIVDLLDGRTISVPLLWYPRLLSATPAQRANWRLAGGGFGIHWPDVDEDLSTDGLLRGAPAPRGSAAS